MSRIYGCSDIDRDSSELSNTYVSMEEGCLYVASIKDLFACEVVGRGFGERMKTELVVRPLEQAVAARRPAAGLIHHSDCGSQVSRRPEILHAPALPR